jgi:hypothetical protein
MIKALITFVSLFLILYFGIDLFRQFTKKEKWEVGKTALYSLFISIVVLVILFGLVIVF